MNKHFNDEELIRLVQEKPPEELTSEEIELLRSRLRESDHLQEVLVRQLQMESYLNDVLGEIQISVDAILDGTTEIEPKIQGRGFSRWTWPTVLLLMLAFILGTVAFLSNNDDQLPEDITIAAENNSKDNSQDTNLTANATGSTNSTAEDAINSTNPNSSSPENVVTTKKVKQKEIAQAAPDPWATSLDPAKPPRKFQDICFAGVPSSEVNEFPANQLQPWFESVQGKPHRIQNSKVGNETFSQFEGAAKLRAPWPHDAVLRLSLFEIKSLKIDFWNGEKGISFDYFQQRSPHLWTAYQVSREGNQPEGKQQALLTTDNSRYVRSNSGTFEIRHQNGSLIMSRGNILLLKVPMAAPPDEVYFTGSVRFRSIAIYRSEPFPLKVRKPGNLVSKPGHPALLDWHTDLPAHAELIQSGQGSVELAVLGQEKNEKTAVVSSGTSIGRPGLYEIVTRFEDPQPGTGLFLGDAEGTPIHHIGFFNEKRTDQTILGFGWTQHGYLKPTDIRLDLEHNSKLSPLPLAGRQQWLRVVTGIGCLKIWTSADGENWGQVGYTPVRNVQSNYSTVGLYAVPGEKTIKIKLQQLEVRELSAITSLASDEVRELVPEFTRPRKIDISQWFEETITSRPDNIEMPEWRRACAIGLLEQHPSPDFAKLLLLALIDDGINLQENSIDDRLQILAEAAILLDLWNAPDAAAFAQTYETLGNILYVEGEKSPYSQIAPAIYAAPIWSDARTQTNPDSLVRSELLHNIYESNWLQVHQLYKQIEFWNESAKPNTRWQDRIKQFHLLLEWAESQAIANLPKLNVKRPLVTNKEWKHTLVSELSKEGYNVMAEFEAAIKGKAFKDACQIISATGSSGMLGLLPDAQDAQLLVSLPAAVALAMDEYPDLRRTMSDQFGPVGELRVRESIVNANVDAVESASIRFYGTTAASEAHSWLGDRSLAAGRFGEAIDRYRHALKSTSSANRAELLARLRLCAAMLGYEEGQPISTTVEVGNRNMTPAQFESLITNLKTTHSKTAIAGKTVKRPTEISYQSTPSPTAFTIQPRAQFTGSMGKSPGSSTRKGTDWVAQQMSVVVDEKQIYASNRFQVVAYDSSTGAQKWAASLGNEQGNSHSLPRLSMKPLVAGDRLFVRRLASKGSELASLESANGKVIWRTRPEIQITSDPVYVLGKLLALIQSFTPEGLLQLDVARFHPDTGDILSQRPFLQLRDIWGRQPQCRVISVEGKLLCLIGGTIASSDPTGQPIWVRRQTWIPPSQDPLHIEQHLDIPVVENGRVYITQPGVRSIECIEASSGRLLWSAAVMGIKRALGVVNDLLIVETRQGLEAYDCNSGQLLWRHHAQNILHASMQGGQGAILYTRSIPLKNNQYVPAIVWLDPKSGRELAHELIGSLADADPYLGPFISTKDHLWAFSGKGIKTPQRELIEFIPDSTRSSIPVPDESLTRWIPPTLPHIQTDVDRVCPGWTLVSAKMTTNDGLRPDLLGQKNVLFTQAAAGKSIQLVRELNVPENGTSVLALKVGHQPATSWELSVHLNRQQVVKELIDDKSAAKGWKDLRVNLKDFAGKKIWITVSQHPVESSKVTAALWKDLKIITQ